MTPVAIVGASGYTGAELVRLLLGHPDVELAGLFARSSAGQPVARVLPSLAGVVDGVIEPAAPEVIAARARVAFLALPHGEGARLAADLLERGLKVIDLSADFRLRDAAAHTSWYGQDPVPGLRARAVYGLPERHRAEIAKADLVAVPGCYPTATVLAIAPLLPLVGASGYTGAELIRLLLGHPAVEIAGLYARTSAGQPIAKIFPQLAGVVDRTVEPVDPDAIAARARVVFLALPHGEGARLAADLLARGVKVTRAPSSCSISAVWRWVPATL